MEHRWSERNSIELDAVIYQSKDSSIKCKTHNVSIEGASLGVSATAFEGEVPQKVEVSFFGQDQINSKPIPAMVVHNSSGNLGLMFMISDDLVLRDIKRLLHQAGAYEHTPLN